MPKARSIIEPRRLITKMIDRVGIAIDDSSPAVKRMVAQRIIDLQCDLNNFVQLGLGTPRLELVLGNLGRYLVTLSDDQRGDLGDGSGPYSIKGIAFSVLVQLVRLESCALKWGWTPEELRALGLDLRRDEEIIWAAPDHIEIEDSSGRVSCRYRIH